MSNPDPKFDPSEPVVLPDDFEDECMCPECGDAGECEKCYANSPEHYL